jgi:hypothetical protein
MRVRAPVPERAGQPFIRMSGFAETAGPLLLFPAAQTAAAPGLVD